MAWQRKTPFGYQISGGQAACQPVEAEAVRDIFARYIAGASLAQIAGAMTAQGVPYHQHTSTWNKNMVKRILENQTYLGGAAYPRLVSDEDFLAASLQRKDRNVYKPCPACLKPIREKAVCGRCGGRLCRGTRTCGLSYWHCQNSDCGATVGIADSSLKDSVLEQLRELASEPDRIPLPALAEPVPSTDVLRIENEINLNFNRADLNAGYMKALIFAAAAERYAGLPDLTAYHALERLQERLEQGPAGEADLWELLELAVVAIRIGKGGEVTLVLKNGEEEPA